MKRLIGILVVMMLVLCFAGCSPHTANVKNEDNVSLDKYIKINVPEEMITDYTEEVQEDANDNIIERKWYNGALTFTVKLATNENSEILKTDIESFAEENGLNAEVYDGKTVYMEQNDSKNKKCGYVNRHGYIIKIEFEKKNGDFTDEEIAMFNNILGSMEMIYIPDSAESPLVQNMDDEAEAETGE